MTPTAGVCVWREVRERREGKRAWALGARERERDRQAKASGARPEPSWNLLGTFSAGASGAGRVRARARRWRGGEAGVEGGAPLWMLREFFPPTVATHTHMAPRGPPLACVCLLLALSINDAQEPPPAEEPAFVEPEVEESALSRSRRATHSVDHRPLHACTTLAPHRTARAHRHAPAARLLLPPRLPRRRTGSSSTLSSPRQSTGGKCLQRRSGRRPGSPGSPGRRRPSISLLLRRLPPLAWTRLGPDRDATATQRRLRAGLRRWGRVVTPS